MMHFLPNNAFGFTRSVKGKTGSSGGEILLFFLLFLLPWTLHSQPTYHMQDLIVFDCEGIFTDSNEGAEEGQYAHNEDYTFTICVDGATEIIVVFDFFATEATYDVLSVYDGPDINAPLIVELSGALQPPPTLLALSGCITFHFVSDENIAAIGWQASWSVEINQPVAPDIQLSATPECPMNSAIFTVPGGIPCDVLVPESFSVIGPVSSSVSEVLVLDCDDDTGLAETFEVVFDPPPDRAGNYRLFFSGELPDDCGNLHDVETNLLFSLANCPLAVEILLTGGLQCEGECTELTAVVHGGSGDYSYNWSFTTENTENVELCADENTPIQLLVVDNNGSNTGEASFFYEPLELPVFLNPFASDTFCAARGDYFFQMSIPGGEFYSEIIVDAHRTTGRYQFWRWRTEEEPLSRDIITYYAPNGCSVSDTVYVRHIRSGDREAACLGSDPWVVSGGFPDGGYWSGPHIDSNGVFSPVEEGSFVITYNAMNGCSENKRVDVGADLIMPDVDTICSSQLYFLEANIYGGRWYGPGIRNRINGRLEPWRVDPNQTYTYTYVLEGCEAEMEIHIKELYAGGEVTMCSADSLLFLPVTGDWSGPGTYIQNLNAFDISHLGPGEYQFTLSLGECVDQLTLYLEEVRIGAYNPTFFCPENELHFLGDFLWVHPWGGNVNGNGLVNIGDEWFFNPEMAGPGEHFIFYEHLACVDSVLLRVDFPAEIPDYLFCDRNNPAILEAEPSGGFWSGPGFLDPSLGLFDPRLAGQGNHAVIYTAPSGCETATTIEVTEFDQVSIGELDRQYCYFDTTISVITEPPGGHFFINGVPADPYFSPTDLGTGIHELLYRRGEGACASSERIFITVLNPISIQSGLENDTICAGGNAVLELSASGGTGGLIYTWGGDLGFGNSQIVFPAASSWFYVTVEDQCSEPLMDSVYVHVNLLPEVNHRSGPPVCYGQESFVEIEPDYDGNLSFQWSLDSIVTGPRLEAGPGIYTLLVLDEDSGCSREFSLNIPGSGPLRANFSTIPNQPCIDLANNRLELINLSFGFERLRVDFGDGAGPVDFSSGDLIFHEYHNPGEYTIELFVENELGCRDTFSRPLCVENVVRLFVPNAFSPNSDGSNDLLQLYSIGIAEEMNWEIYDRYGARVFRSNRLGGSWDGSFNGSPMPSGVYLLIATFKDQYTGELNNLEQTVHLLR